VLRSVETKGEERMCIGVVADARRPAAATIENLRAFASRMVEDGCRAVVALGNMGRTADEIAKAYEALTAPAGKASGGESRRRGGGEMLLLAMPGTLEDMREYRKAIGRLILSGIPVVDLSKTRILAWPEITLVSMPGHHRHDHLGAGWWACGFTDGDVSALDALLGEVEASGGEGDALSPLLMVSHASPLMTGPDGLDMGFGSAHGGHEGLARLMRGRGFLGGAAAHVQEAGPAASRTLRWSPLGEGEWSSRMVVNPGSADSVTHAARRPDCEEGSAAVIEIKKDPEKRSGRLLRHKTLCAVTPL
jgi:hypothetical protein